MRKKFLLAFIVSLICILACACGGSTSESDSSSKSDTTVDSIDLTYDEGNLKYVGFEKAVPELTEEENAYVFIFDFTNTQDSAAQCQSVFKIQYFQNGAELTNNASWDSRGGDQYELVNAFFSEALNGGTIRFGQLVIPKDSSPITVMATRNGAEDTVQMMEVDIESVAVNNSTSESVDVADIDSMLQGEWSNGTGTLRFDNGSVYALDNGTEVMSGEYTINTDESNIVGVFHASDADVKMTIPYFVEDGVLHIHNNKGEEMTRV